MAILMSNEADRGGNPDFTSDQFEATTEVTVGNPVGNEMVRYFPQLNNPRVRYNVDNGKLYIHPPVIEQSRVGGVTYSGWLEFEGIESALQAGPSIMDGHDRDDRNDATRMESAIGMVGSISRQIEESVKDLNSVELEKLVARVVVEEQFSDAPKDERRSMVDQILMVTRKDRSGPVTAPNPTTPIWRLREKLASGIFEEMANQPHMGVLKALRRERAVERIILEEAADYAAFVSTLNPGKDTLLKNEWTPIENFFRRNISLEVIRLKPYSDVALESRLLILGRTNSEIENITLNRYLASDVVKSLQNSGGRTRHLTEAKAKIRLKKIAEKIRLVLDQGELSL